MRQVPNEGFHLVVPAVFTRTELQINRDLEYPEWADLTVKIGQARDAANWWIGDSLIAGEIKYGETYAQAAADTGISEETLQILVYVARKVTPDRRVKDLTWSHHREVAKLEPDEQTKWLKRALEKGWSVRDLHAQINKKAGKEEKTGEDKEAEGCACCGDSPAPMKVCGSCASVATQAHATVGVKGAISLMKKKPSKPQLDMLQWAFEHISEPRNHSSDEAESEWHARYDALKRVVKGKEEKKAA